MAINELRSVSTFIKADSEAEAIEASRYRLRYFAPERFLFPKVAG